MHGGSCAHDAGERPPGSAAQRYRAAYRDDEKQRHGQHIGDEPVVGRMLLDGRRRQQVGSGGEDKARQGAGSVHGSYEDRRVCLKVRSVGRCFVAEADLDRQLDRGIELADLRAALDRLPGGGTAGPELAGESNCSVATIRSSTCTVVVRSVSRFTVNVVC